MGLQSYTHANVWRSNGPEDNRWYFPGLFSCECRIALALVAPGVMTLFFVLTTFGDYMFYWKLRARFRKSRRSTIPLVTPIADANSAQKNDDQFTKRGMHIDSSGTDIGRRSPDSNPVAIEGEQVTNSGTDRNQPSLDSGPVAMDGVNLDNTNAETDRESERPLACLTQA